LTTGDNNAHPDFHCTGHVVPTELFYNQMLKYPESSRGRPGR
jgi:hypothetical protein